MREPPAGKMRKVHPYQWLWEPLETDPTFLVRPMFGGKAVYLDGRLMLYFSARKEPWRGLLVCTDRTHHESLLAEFRSLARHPVLPKWLYLSEGADSFEPVAGRLVALTRGRDPRIGVSPKTASARHRTAKIKPKPFYRRQRRKRRADGSSGK